MVYCKSWQSVQSLQHRQFFENMFTVKASPKNIWSAIKEQMRQCKTNQNSKGRHKEENHHKPKILNKDSFSPNFSMKRPIKGAINILIKKFVRSRRVIW